MDIINLIKPEKVNLRDHPILNEHWLQNVIANSPEILGLGELVLKDKESKQPYAGRLNILLQDAEINKRYEVEIQLGKTDESHIIRTIEYRDIERKIEEKGLDLMDYEKRGGRYRIKLSMRDIKMHREFIAHLIRKSKGMEHEDKLSEESQLR